MFFQLKKTFFAVPRIDVNCKHCRHCVSSDPSCQRMWHCTPNTCAVSPQSGISHASSFSTRLRTFSGKRDICVCESKHFEGHTLTGCNASLNSIDSTISPQNHNSSRRQSFPLPSSSFSLLLCDRGRFGTGVYRDFHIRRRCTSCLCLLDVACWYDSSTRFFLVICSRIQYTYVQSLSEQSWNGF